MNALAGAIASLVVAGLAVGCSASRGPPASGGGGGDGAAKQVTPAELRALAMSAADSYATAIAQASDQLRSSTTQPAVADWAWQNKIATSLASFTNATGPDDALCLLDMVLFATLKRQGLEDHWIPTLLKDEGKPVLEIYRRAENDVWATAGKSMTKAQQQEMRELIDQWKQKHPGQYYVSHVRFADMASQLGFGADHPRGKAPGSLFGLLGVDPLAGLDPVTAELRNYRALSERMIYMSVRMPLVLGWQVEYAANRATSTPEVHRMLDSFERFTGITGRFTELIEKLPADITKERQAALVQVQQVVKDERQAALTQVHEVVKDERQAAVDQVNQRVDGQRQAITDELTKQTSSLRQIVGDVSGLVGTVEQAVASVNESTSKTITTTEEAGRRTMTLGFWYGLVLIVVIIFCPPVALLMYRLALKRWVGPGPALAASNGDGGNVRSTSQTSNSTHEGVTR